jgi:hypothetical protein
MIAGAADNIRGWLAAGGLARGDVPAPPLGEAHDGTGQLPVMRATETTRSASVRVECRT